MKVIAVIPARYTSTRFPGKPLAILAGKPIIQHVYERVMQSNLFADVIVATDDLRISEAVADFGGSFQLTSSHHLSGSDRIAEVIQDIECDIVVNVQGDEPLIEAAPLAELLTAFRDDQVQVASLMTAFTDPDILHNGNIVKVATDLQDNALYFSRSPLPCDRDGIPDTIYYRHIGVYAYRKAALLHFVRLAAGRLEQIEKLEQLRLLENGIKIRMVRSDYQGIGIDSPADLIAVQRLF